MNLKDNSLFKDEAFVAGKWIKPGKNTIAVTNPATGEKIGEVPNLGAAEVKVAIEKGEEVQKPWAARTAKDRSDIIRKWYELIIENKEDLGKILTIEQGKPLAEAIGEITIGAHYVEWFAEEAKRIYGDVIPAQTTGNRIVVIKQPIGVVCAITPWNFPSSMITRKVAPALAAGCSVVLKPSELTPYSAIALVELAERAGLPSGLLSVITGDAEPIGAEMTSNPKVRKISFTGSTRVGALLAEQSAPTVKKVSLELGGNAPFIVFEDADLDAAAEGAIIAKYRNNGQTCVCTNRFYVHDKIYDAFAQKLKENTLALPIGDGMADGTILGPLIDDRAVTKVQSHIDDAVEKGAKILTGGKAHEMGGGFFEPTILADTNGTMRIAREETFGPVAPLFRFTDEADVIAQANDTEYGLAAYFYTKDLSRTWRVSEALEYGMVGVNSGLITTPQAPFGGVKSSGLGREGSKYGLDDFLEIKYISMAEI